MLKKHFTIKNIRTYICVYLPIYLPCISVYKYVQTHIYLHTEKLIHSPPSPSSFIPVLGPLCRQSQWRIPVMKSYSSLQDKSVALVMELWSDIFLVNVGVRDKWAWDESKDTEQDRDQNREKSG